MRRATEGPFVSSPAAKHSNMLCCYSCGIRATCNRACLGQVWHLSLNTSTGAQANQMLSRKAKLATKIWVTFVSLQDWYAGICWCSLDDYLTISAKAPNTQHCCCTREWLLQFSCRSSGFKYSPREYSSLEDS